MLYTNLKINEKNYKLRLTTFQASELVKHTERNPLELLIEAGQTTNYIPLLKILHYAIRWQNPDIKFEEVCEIYDEMIDNGHSINELFALVREILRAAGIGFKKHPTEVIDALKNLGIEIDPKHIETDEERVIRVKEEESFEKEGSKTRKNK